MRTITNQDILDNIQSVEGWTPDIDPNMGTLLWENPDFEYTYIYACPEFNGSPIRFDILFPDGDYQKILSLNVPSESSIEEQLKQYEVTLRAIIMMYQS